MVLLRKSIFSSRLTAEEIDQKIKQLLPISDYDWATKFKNEIMHHPDTVEIRKIIKDIPMEDLRKYHDSILKKIYSPLEEFNQYIYQLRLLTQKAKSIAYDVINIGPYIIKNKKDIKDIEDAFNTYYFFLSQEDSPLQMMAEDKYDKVACEILNDSRYDDELKKIYLQERRSLNRYLMIHFLRSYDNFLVRKVNFLNREHDAYSQAFEARVYQHRYHGYYGPKK